MEECLSAVHADVLIDLTTPEVGMQHTKTALEFGVRPVVGTTGFTKENLARTRRVMSSKEKGCIIAPNFALGAVLMMKFSQLAGRYFQDVEIIELHHDQKLDAPSGTAVKTAQMIAQVREEKYKAIQMKKKRFKEHEVQIRWYAYPFCPITWLNCTSTSDVWCRMDKLLRSDMIHITVPLLCLVLSSL